MSDHDDRHFRKYPLRLDASAYEMNGAMNVLHAIRDRAYGYGANDDQMNASNEANVVDALDAGFALDVYTFHIRTGSLLLVGAYI